jgi:hypothetical protein
MLSDIDWMMHAKAIRSMAFRTLRHGETEVALRLLHAASQMEILAQEAAAASLGGKVVKLTVRTGLSRSEPIAPDQAVRAMDVEMI